MSAAISDSKPPGQYYCPTCERNFPEGERCPTDGTRLVRIKVPIDPLIGRELDGRYKIIQKLGQGGMGAVYRGQQLGLGREVAIKVVSAHLVAETEVVKRFLREAKLASSLSHPNAVAVLDFNQTEDGQFYLVMELVSGNTLDKVLETDKVMRPERLVRIAAQVCDALEGAHALSIVHRDLKPSNIMLLSRGRDLVKVLDFGLAKSLATDQATTTMTNAGSLLGTPAFIPPELALGEPCDGRADQYSLGVVLYLMGSGRLPFISDSAHELIAMHASEPAPPMTGVPPALGRVIDRMLQKSPADRYDTAADVREALEAALESSRMNTPPAGIPFQSGPSLGQTVTVPSTITGPVPVSARAVTPSSTNLAISDTMAASPRPKRRWVIPVALLAAIGTGIGAYMVFHTPDAAPVPTPPPIEVKKALPPPPPQPPPPTDDKKKVGLFPDAPPTKQHAADLHSLEGVVIPADLLKPKHTKPATKPHSIDKTVAHPPPIEDVKPPVVETKPKPGQGSGSGLPF